MPDDPDAAPGTTEGSDVERGTPDERNEQGQREQGVRSEESDDLSSPQFTVHRDDSAEA